jgi:GATA-binding protein
MKKSVIKRRKRVVPAAQGAQISDSPNMGSPESDHHSPPAEAPRGSINPDGSVNLGFRMREEQRSYLPDPTSTGRQNGQLPSSDLTAYASSSSNTQYHEPLDSLHNDNRLPPMASYPSPTQQRPSLSPNSFLSPSRKRSFSATEIDPLPSLSDTTAPAAPPTNPKRLSSIKSILNPGFQDSDSGNERASPRYLSHPSPGISGGMSSAMSDSERSKVERRELLQREAEKMREALKAKERELEELGGE